MRIYTINVPATFAFDIYADSEEEALKAARKLLHERDPINDSYGGLNSEFASPWIVISGADKEFPEAEAVDVFEEEEN